MSTTNAGLWRGPLGPLRDKVTVTIGSADVEFPDGVIVQINLPAAAGTLVYRTLEGEDDQTEAGLAQGDSINVAGVPVVIKTIKGSSTVTSVVVGYL